MGTGVTILEGDVLGYESISPADTATGFTASNYKAGAGTLRAERALISCESNTVNFTLHGTAPTAAAGTNIGTAFLANDSYLIVGYTAIANFQCIDRVSGSAGTVKVIFFA